MDLDYSMDICMAVESKYKSDVLDCIYIYKELYDATKDEVFNDRLLELCKRHELCPKCFEHLNIKHYEETVDEMSIDIIYERKCNKCGHTIY